MRREQRDEPPRLTVEEDPRPEDVRFLEESLHRFNVEATGIADGGFLGVFLRAADDAPVAGAFGWTWGGTCYLRHVYVSEGLRRQGHGTTLLKAVEAQARSCGCRQIMLETHDFQAPGFYRKLGFEVAARIADYPRGHHYLTFLKRLG